QPPSKVINTMNKTATRQVALTASERDEVSTICLVFCHYNAGNGIVQEFVEGRARHLGLVEELVAAGWYERGAGFFRVGTGYECRKDTGRRGACKARSGLLEREPVILRQLVSNECTKRRTNHHILMDDFIILGHHH